MEKRLSDTKLKPTKQTLVWQAITFIVCELQSGFFYQNVVKTMLYLTTLYEFTRKIVSDRPR